MSHVLLDATPGWAAPVVALASRVLGSEAGDRIRVRRLDGAGRAYRYSAADGVLTIAGTDAVSACVGLHHYLRAHAGIAVHWDTTLPLGLTRLPDAPATTGEARVARQYMFNFCTFSYTMANWTWAEWEREIDWMALHGITMPLAITGHEAVLVDAYRALGLPEQDALAFVGADAYLAFTVMGNLDSAVGPATRSLVEERAALGARILQRERELGMTPVLPAFTGNVPAALFPGAVTPRDWQGHTTHVLAPDDPAFSRVAAEVTRAQVARYGTDHLYASDPFIEMIPVDDDRDYPGRVADALLTGVTSVDPHATWVLQSWPFSYQSEFWTADRVRSFLRAIPSDRVIVLDLWAEEDPQWDAYDGFAGRSWVWCALLNFGGRSDPVGDLQGAVDEAERALSSTTPPAGIGLTMEATRTNPVFFELVADLAWTPVPDLRAWVARFALERYGASLPDATRAWTCLLDTVYAPSGRRVFPEDFLGILTRDPVLVTHEGADRLATQARSLVWFEPARLLEALEGFTRAAEGHPDRVPGPLGRDLADTAIAVTSRLIDAMGARIAEGDASRSGEFLAAFDALDAVLATRPELRLSTWLGAPHRPDPVRDKASRQILTSWNDEPRHQLDDYSARIWHGLVGSYYRRRWAAWARRLGDADPAALRHDLDEIWQGFMADGAAESPSPTSTLPTAARELLARFGATFLHLVVPSDRPDREDGRP
jgi:alpha-N-acetylglucosaminidase